MEHIQAPPADIVHFIAYDPDTGALTWLAPTSHQSRRAAGDKAGAVTVTGYICVRFRGRGYLAHRLAWLLATGEWPDFYIDHINGDRTDNRFVNLRLATKSQNGQNKVRRGPLLKGVSLNRKDGRVTSYLARIRLQRRTYYLGSFATEAEAHAAYCAAAVKYHGEFARFD